MILQTVPTIPKLKNGERQTKTSDPMIDDKETYLVIFSTARKTIPTIAKTQKPTPKA